METLHSKTVSNKKLTYEELKDKRSNEDLQATMTFSNYIARSRDDENPYWSTCIQSCTCNLTTQHKIADTSYLLSSRGNIRKYLPPGFNDIFKNKEHSDITLKVVDVAFKAHKNILVSGSGYFKTMFLCGFKEASMSEIELHVPGELTIFETLLEFIYSGNMTHLSPNTVMATLGMAYYLQMDSAVNLCCIAIMHWYCRNMMSLECALEVLQRPEEQLQDLQTQSKYYIVHHLQHLNLFDDSKKRLPTTAELMEKCLDSIEDIRSDEKCLYSVMSWLKLDWEERKQYAHSLLYKLKIADKAYELFYRLMEVEELREKTQLRTRKDYVYVTYTSISYHLKLNEEEYKYILDSNHGLGFEELLCVGWVESEQVLNNPSFEQPVEDRQSDFPVKPKRKNNFKLVLQDFRDCDSRAILKAAIKAHRTHVSSVFEELYQLRKGDIYCDVGIKVGERVFKAHKNVLVSFSNHFKEILQDPDIEEVVIDGKSGTFETLIDFIYTGQMKGISSVTVIDILNMACSLRIKSAVTLLEHYLTKRFNAKRITLEIALHISKRQEPDLESLRKSSRDYLTLNGLLLIRRHPEQASFAYLEEHLPKLKTNDESTYTQFLLRWLTARWDDRKHYAFNLLRTIRLGLLSQSLLKKLEEITHEVSDCRVTIEEVLNLKKKFASNRLQDIPLYVSHPHWFATRTTKEGLIALGGTHYSDDFLINSRWVDANVGLPEYLTNHSSVIVNERLCIAGGRIEINESRDRCTNSFRWYDTARRQWKNLASMHQHRCNFALVYMNEYVYAIGGDWRYGLLNDCERYSVTNDRWEKLPAMPYHCQYPAAEVFNDKLFVYGLKKGCKFDYILQVLTPSWRGSEGSWEVMMRETITMKSMNLIRPVITVQNEKLYRIAQGIKSRWGSQVNQLLVSPRSVTVGPDVDQCLDKRYRPGCNLHPVMFCIEEQLYANVHGCILPLKRQIGCEEHRLKEVTNKDDMFRTACVALMKLDPAMPAQTNEDVNNSRE